MQTLAVPAPAAPARRSAWAGSILSGLVVLFLLFDAAIHIAQIPPVVEGCTQLGFSPAVFVPLGYIELACVALYLFPRTAFLGALLLTGYLGGAVAVHVRVGHPMFSHVLFPVYTALLLWGGLYLRSAALRALVSLRS